MKFEAHTTMASLVPYIDSGGSSGCMDIIGFEYSQPKSSSPDQSQKFTQASTSVPITPRIARKQEASSLGLGLIAI